MNTTQATASPPEFVKLAYTKEELQALTGLCTSTLYRLEQRGLLRSVRGVRTKIYSRKAVMDFLEGKAAVR